MCVAMDFVLHPTNQSVNLTASSDYSFFVFQYWHEVDMSSLDLKAFNGD
jgi:hypothetical protein